LGKKKVKIIKHGLKIFIKLGFEFFIKLGFEISENFVGLG